LEEGGGSTKGGKKTGVKNGAKEGKGKKEIDWVEKGRGERLLEEKGVVVRGVCEKNGRG